MTRRSGAKSPASEETYDMQDVVDFKVEGRKELWRIRWKNYGPKDDTWEPRDNILEPGKEIALKMEKLRDAYHSKEQKASPSRRASPARRTSSLKASRKRQRKSNEISSAHISESGSARVTRSSPSAAKQPPSPSPRRSAASRVPTKVSHIAKGSGGRASDPDGYEVYLSTGSGTKEEKIRMELRDVKKEYPDLLLEYLLSRIRFKEST